MYQYIYIGDVHAVPLELEDCKNLVHLVDSIKEQYPLAVPIWLGDQHHSHEDVSLTVLGFWRWAFSKLGGVCIVGNHDQNIPGSDTHIMDAYRDLVTVVWPSYRIGPLQFVSYCKDKETFYNRCDDLGGCLVAHQDFCGFRYESGKVTLSDLKPPSKYKQIISGHLHSPQESGNTWYIGAPRWRTQVDALVEKRAVWLIEHSEDGIINKRIPFYTNDVCKRIVVLKDTPENPITLIDGAVNKIEIVGPADYVQKRRKELSELGAIVRGTVTKTQKAVYQESLGPLVALEKRFKSYVPRNSTPKKDLIKLLEDRMDIKITDE